LGLVMRHLNSIIVALEHDAPEIREVAPEF